MPPNKLIHETSPYLLQHANNPVEWYPWGEEALKLAKEENKPILVSIGYSACHWCHVMERESFEDEATASIMNKHFINIKIDREERPDLDHIYMDAVQAISGAGGWPLNVFLTPDGKPFYGGTYFPPMPAFNRPSWTDLLLQIRDAFNERRSEIDQQAEQLTEHLVKANSFGLKQEGNEETILLKNVIEAAKNSLANADKNWGGFGNAPKFPQTFSIQFLLRFSNAVMLNDNAEKGLVELAQASKSQALKTLDKMIDGGIYDQVGGGFARYSTDEKWLVPHFEKMLYDNALILSAISEAYQLTGNDRYSTIITETINFLEREMMHPAIGFYSALDADSEGVEGKFYVWEKTEVEKLLEDDADIFCEFYDITSEGNFEHKNIPWRKMSEQEFAKSKGIQSEELKSIIERGKKVLLAERSKRIRPQLDDKIILGWNALLNTAMSKCFAATGKERYLDLAVKNMEFLLASFFQDGQYHHTWKNNQARHPAFLDDYAYLIQALIALQEVTGDTQYLLKAKELTDHVMGQFSEEGSGFFLYTAAGQKDVIVRKREVFDGAQPSGNSVMSDNLYRLGLYFGIPEWKEMAMGNVRELSRVIIRYPTSFGMWNSLLLELATGSFEIVIMGRSIGKITRELLREYIPNKILMSSEVDRDDFPLLVGKQTSESTSIYLCRDYACSKPVSAIDDLLQMIRSK